MLPHPIKWTKLSKRIKNHSQFWQVEELFLFLQTLSSWPYFQLHPENISFRGKTSKSSHHHINIPTQICGFPPYFFLKMNCPRSHLKSFPHLSSWFQSLSLLKNIISPVWRFVTPWTVAHQDSLSMEFSRQEYWSGWPCPAPGDCPDPGIKPRSPALQVDSCSGFSGGQRRPKNIICSSNSPIPPSLLFSLTHYH